MNQVIKTIKEHRSIRSFNDVKVTDDQITEIIECGLRAPTAGNMMLYSIIKIKDQKNLQFLCEKCDNQKFISSANFALIFLADANKFYKFFKDRNVENYKEPSIGDFMFANQDCMIAAQNCAVAAESMGIGTCYIGDIMENYEDIKTHFNLPNNVMPVTMIVFGNYNNVPPLRERFNKEFVVFDEIYPDINKKFIDKMFEKEESKKSGFAKLFFARKIDSDFFKELNRSVNLYVDEWRKK